MVGAERVIGVDLHDAEVIADLSSPAGRQAAIDGITQRADGGIDGLVTWAGLAGLTDVPCSLLASVTASFGMSSRSFK